MSRLGTMAFPLLLLLAVAFAVEPAHASQEESARVAASGPVADSERDTNPFLQHARLHVEDVPLAEALNELAAASGVRVAFSSTHVPGDRRVSCECMEVSVLDAASILLEGIPFDVVVLGDHLVVREQQRLVPEFRPMNASLPPLSPAARGSGEGRSLSALLNPRQGTVTGQVTDATSLAPLSAAQVHIPAAGVGTISAADGSYQLTDVPVGTHTVVAERLGYEPTSQEITVEDGATVTIDFQLRQQALALDEVIVTGTPGGSTRRAIGNVVAQVDRSSLELASQTRVEQAIGNRVAGVRMMQPPSQVGGDARMRIRGSSSISLPGDPLIYVDGVRLNTRNEFVGRTSSTSRLADIDPSTIESIEIIKGPAAATLYGTEAANGVIQIITSRGVEGAATFNASMELGGLWQPDPAKNFGIHYFRDPATGEIDGHNLYELESERMGRDMFTTGLIQRYNVGVRGGTELFQYSASYTRSAQDGHMRMDFEDMDRGNVNLTTVPRDDLRLHVSATRSVRDTRNSNAGQCTLDCWADPVADRDGGRPPYQARIDYAEDIRTSSRTTWSLEISHEPTDWFTHRLQGGVDDALMQRVDFTPRREEEFGRWFGNSNIGVRSMWIVDTPTRTLDYAASLTLPLGSDVEAVTSVGMQYYNEESTQSFIQGRNFAVGTLSTIGAASEQTGSELYSENSTLGSYVQTQFDWLNRRFVTLAVRFDDNSAFGEDFDAAIYPKVSGTWVLSDEDFWMGHFGISQLRLRGAWGQAGMQPDAFAAQRLFTPTTGPRGLPALIPSAIGNPDLGPERGSEIELGFDASFFQDRGQIEFTYFDRTTTDAIVAVPNRPSVGFPGTRFDNIGETHNWGTETTLSYAVIPSGRRVGWDARLSLTTMESEVRDLGGIEGLTVATMGDQFGGVGGLSRSQFHVEGFPIASLFDFKIVQAEFADGPGSEVINVMCDGGVGSGEFRRQGGEMVPCSEAPRVFLGQVEPSWQVNLTQDFRFLNNWQLTVGIDAMGGHHINADYLAGKNTRHSRPHVFQDDPFFEAYRAVSRAPNETHGAGFAKLRELALQYRVPQSMADRMSVTSANVTATWFNVANLWIEQEFTPSGQRIWDPEMHSPEQNFPGVPMGSGPPLSQATVRVNVTF